MTTPDEKARAEAMLHAVAKFAGWRCDTEKMAVYTDHSGWLRWNEVEAIWQCAQDALAPSGKLPASRVEGDQ